MHKQKTFQLHSPILRTKCPQLLHYQSLSTSSEVLTKLIDFIYLNEFSEKTEPQILLELLKLTRSLKIEGTIVSLCNHHLVESFTKVFTFYSKKKYQ